MMNKKASFRLFTMIFIFSLACNAVTGLPDGGTSQPGDTPDGFSAQVDGFSAESNAEGSVLLKWEPIGGAEQYLLEVKIGDEYLPLATLPADQTSYEDANVPPATHFTYRLSSLVGSQQANSKEITIETPQVVSNPLKVSIEFDQTPAAVDFNNFDPNSIDPNTFDPNNMDPSMFMAQPIQTETVLGPQGGEISVTGSNGVIYTLSVPPNALRFDVTITLKPISAISDLPLSGGLMAAVYIEPESLVFDIPAALTMTPPADFPEPAGPLVTAFAFEADGQEFHLYPFAATDGQSSAGGHLASLQAVPDFYILPGDLKPAKNGGGYGQGSGTAQDVKEIARNPSSKSQNRTEQALAVSELSESEPKTQAALAEIGEAIKEKAELTADMSKLMEVLDDFETYTSVAGDKYKTKLTDKILDQLVKLVHDLLEKSKRDCLKENMEEDDLKAQELVRRLTNASDGFWKTFVERFKQKYGQKLLDDLAKEKTCSYTLTMSSKLTQSSDGSTLTATANILETELSLGYFKGEINLFGTEKENMALKLAVSGLCDFPLQQYDNLSFISHLTPVFNEGKLTDFRMEDFDVKGWKAPGGGSANEGDDCPVMIALKGGGDYWTGMFIGVRSIRNPMITGWKLQPQDGGGIKATWRSPSPDSFAAPGANAMMTEKTTFELTITNKSK